MKSYTWKDSNEYTSGTTNQYIKSWSLWDIFNNYVTKEVPRYSTISRITFSVDAKQNLSLSKGSIGAFLSIYEDDVAGDDTVVALPYQSDVVTNSYKTFSNEVTSYFRLTGENCGQPGEIQPYGILKYLCVNAHATVPRKHSFKNISLEFEYNDQYTISTSVSPSNSGTVSGGGTKTAGTIITLTATPNPGYKFVKWSDGEISNPRNVLAAKDASYTAIFEVDKIYVTYDSLFSFKRWKETNLASNSFISVSNVTDIGFTATGLVDDAYTGESRPLIPVEIGRWYTIEFEASGGSFELFVFNCDAEGVWQYSNPMLTVMGNTKKFNFEAVTNYISIRCDVVGTGTIVNFSDFRIYPADCPYMGNTVSAAERTDVNAWSMPTPTREGYVFVGWNTKPDGTGVTYTSSSAYPSADLVLYSQWKLNSSYVIYDSLFSFKRWKETNLASNSFISVSDVTDIGFKGTALVDDAYTDNCRPLIPVVAGKEYTIEVDVETNVDFQLFVFHCDESGAWGIFSLELNARRYNFVPTTNYISIRCDVDGKGNVAKYSNFRIYPSDCPYMSNTLPAAERTDVNAWSMPTPTREGYRFLGWYTQPNGGGTKYTSSSSFPTSDLVLYSHWELQKYTINFKNQDGTTVSTKTLNSGATLGTLPTVSRSGYIFGGWIPCAPVKKIDNTILDSCYYDGAVAYPLLQSYKYTNNLSMHIEVYMEDWMDIKNSTRQIMSCTESGGWGFGYQANSKVDGAEAHGFEVHTGSYTGYDLKFGTSGEYTNNNWYSFDITFSNGVIEVFVNGTSKGKRTASSSTIKYNSSNTIFVGGEAKGDTSSAQNYFKGYISNVFIANQGTKLQIATASTVVNSNIDYYPIWRKSTTFTATFKNHDGSVLQTVSVEHGGTPNYTGSTPTKPSTAEYNYSFSGWSPSIGVITSDTTYVAQFTATKRKYTISTSVTNGTISGDGTYEYGTSVVLTVTPDNGYKFEKWSDGNTQNPRTVTVTGNATYEAQIRRLILKFKSVKIYYPTETNIVSPDNPLIANEKAQIVVQIALE